MKNTKPWYLSKTLWLNFGIAMLPIIIENFALLKEALPGNIYGILMFAAVIGNAFLRFKTSQGISAK